MKTFFFRRFRRIFPPYWIYLGVVALVFAIAFVIGRPEVVTGLKATLQNPWRMEFWQYIGTFFLTATWQDRLVGKGGMMSGQAWSLCYEEQFYFVSGLLLWSCPRRIFTGFAVITAAVLAIYLGSPALGWDLHGFFFDGFWLLFAAGVLVYYRVNYTETRRARLIEVFLFLTFCAFLWAHPSSTWYNRYFYPAGLGFAVLLCWLHPWDEAISTSRLLSPVTFCGRMCYSLYLIHVPIVAIGGKLIYENGVQGFWPTMLVAVPVLTILSVASAHLFAVFVERRFLNQPLTVTKPDSASARSRNWWAFGLGRSPFSQGSPAQSPQEAT
jgi:peptidoglycan/LPS O-acetylase OafA/YrhL